MQSASGLDKTLPLTSASNPLGSKFTLPAFQSMLFGSGPISGRHVLRALLALLISFPAHAQIPDQQISSFIGQTVASVDVAGRPDVDLKNVQELIAVKPGASLSQNDIDSTIANLRRRGGFQDVKVDLEPDEAGARVIFILLPAVYVGMYEFPGAIEEFSYSRLLQVANYNAQMPYSASDVEHAENALVQFFRQHGYFLAEVRPEIEPKSDFGLANVVFHTNLGVQAKIGRVNLAGTTLEETSYLQKKLRSVMARLRGDSLKPGMRYSYTRLQGATRYLQSALVGQNYITGEVKLISAEYDSNTNRADITFQVTPGLVVKVSTVGAHVWRRTARNLVPMYQQNTINDELIKEGQRNLASYFQAKGYFDTTVDVKTVTNQEGMSIVYDIHKDGRHKVKEVAFKGNHHFSGRDLQSHVVVEKGHLFSHGKYSEVLVRSSVKNLRDTYRAAGYSQAEIVPNVIRKNGNAEITFQVTEGPLDVVQDLRIEGNNTLSESQLAPYGMNLGPGKPYSQDLVTKDRNQIMARYLTLGYLNASFHSTAKPAPGDPHHMNVIYQISEGPQVTTATIITDGRQHTRQTTIDRELKIRSGQPLSENALFSSESRRIAIRLQPEGCPRARLPSADISWKAVGSLNYSRSQRSHDEADFIALFRMHL
jgi:outer membrane protein assembly factor BamA